MDFAEVRLGDPVNRPASTTVHWTSVRIPMATRGPQKSRAGSVDSRRHLVGPRLVASLGPKNQSLKHRQRCIGRQKYHGPLVPCHCAVRLQSVSGPELRQTS